jgi:flagella basal body P-ring formation protein FlgA
MIKFKQKMMVGAALCVLAGNAFAAPAEPGRFSIDQAPSMLASALMDEVGGTDIRLATARFSVAGTNKHYSLSDIGAADILGDYQLVNILPSYGNRFSAVLKNDDQKIAVNGRYNDYVDVPVVSSRFRKGDIISASDIDYISMSSSRVRKNVIVDADELVGMQVSRRLMSGKPVLLRDVKRAVLVEKGRMVKIVYRTKYIDLRTVGTALQNAAAGDVIRVKNTKSGAMLQAMINTRGEAVINYGEMMAEESHNREKRKRG